MEEIKKPYNFDNDDLISHPKAETEYYKFMNLVTQFIASLSIQALTTEEINLKITELSEICIRNFRFEYSSIESSVYKLSLTSEENIDFLYENIVMMESVYFDNTNENQTDKVFKFCDHILLALNRISYLKESQKKLEADYLGAQKNFENQIKDVNDKQTELSVEYNKTINNFKTEVNVIKEEMQEEMQKEIQASKTETITNLVAVLGIFSGLVIAFFGDISMFTSIFGNVSESNFVIMVFFSLLLGLIIVDGICLLLYMTARIADKNNLFTKGSKFASWLTILNVSIIAINFILFFYINPIDFSKIISSLS